MMIRKYTKYDIKEINKLGLRLHDNYEFKESEFMNAYVVHDDKFAGFITYQLMYEKVEIIDLIIYEEYRNKGCATNLIKAVIKEAINKKCENITLEENCNNEAAINLYKKLGFTIASKRKKYYKDNDGYLMIKDLR